MNAIRAHLKLVHLIVLCRVVQMAVRSRCTPPMDRNMPLTPHSIPHTTILTMGQRHMYTLCRHTSMGQPRHTNVVVIHISMSTQVMVQIRPGIEAARHFSSAWSEDGLQWKAVNRTFAQWMSELKAWESESSVDYFTASVWKSPWSTWQYQLWKALWST